MILFEFLFFRRGAGSSPKALNDKTTGFRFGLPAVLICCTAQINYRKGAHKEILNGAPVLQTRMLNGWIFLAVSIQANRVVQSRCDCIWHRNKGAHLLGRATTPDQWHMS